MSEDREQVAGRCWECDYLLRGVENPRCPECGRPFDRNNSATLNPGRPIGSLGRHFIKPTRIWLSLAICLATLLIVLSTGWPGQFNFWRWDRTVSFQVDTLKEHWAADGIRWRAFAIGLAIAVPIGAVAALRELLRRALVLRHHPPVDVKGHSRWRSLIQISSIVIAVIWAQAGSARRWGMIWAQRQMAEPSNQYGFPNAAKPPLKLADSEEREVLRQLLTNGTELERRIALKLLIDRKMSAALPVICSAVTNEKDQDVAANELHLIGLYRDASTIALLEKFLTDDRPAIRAAAADAIGIVHSPAYQLPEDSGWVQVQTPRLRMDPGIGLSAFGDRVGQVGNLYHVKEPIPMTPAQREAITSIMLTGRTQPEREAAARALIRWPKPGYQLRIAEWGVWLNEDGELKTMRNIAEEIPPFVHQSGNPISEFSARLRKIVYIDKPVIHITANQAMALEIEVYIHQGRPWFVYPMPDDFELHTATVPNWSPPPAGSTQPSLRRSQLADFDSRELGKLNDLSSGYPWISPNHQRAGSSGGRYNHTNDIIDMGVHWQSLIVSPDKLPWMAEATIPDNPSFAWWKQLREVNCSWLCNRGESERFLYYDGPTVLKAPYKFFMSGKNLESQAREPDELGSNLLGAGAPEISPPQPHVRFSNRKGRIGFFIEVKDNEISAQDLTLPLGEGKKVYGNDVETSLAELLQRRGLSKSETAGLIDTWRDQWIKKQGTRVLLLLSQTDYDTFCPITIRPAPTEIVRVGILVTEFK